MTQVPAHIVIDLPDKEKRDVRDYGAKGDGVTNDTQAINDAINDVSGTLFFPPGMYWFDGFQTSGSIDLAIEGDKKLPVLFPSQEVVDAGHYMFLLSRYSTVEGLTLAADIAPNQRTVPLSDVSGIQPGMVLQIASDSLWSNGHRGVYYRGEIHKITDVTDVVVIEDFTRDHYTTTQTLAIRAWVPNRVSIKNFRITAPYPSPKETSVGIALQQCDGAVVDNVHFSGFENSALLDNLNWNSRFTNIHVHNQLGMNTATTGYGIASNGSVGTHVNGLYTKGLRRAWDAGAISGTELAAINRDWTVQNFLVRGGGDWWPETTENNYGIGMHGPSEGGTIRDGEIQDCRNGITARGRDTIVDGVRFTGSIGQCVSLHENGAGLIVRNSKADQCETFLQLGLAGQDQSANALYDLPIVVQGNVCRDASESFVRIAQNLSVAENLHLSDNNVKAGTLYYGSDTGTKVARSTLQAAQAPLSHNLHVGFRDQPDCAVRLPDHYVVQIPDDSVAHIPHFSPMIGDGRVFMSLMADAGGHALGRLIPNSGGFTNASDVTSNVSATSNGPGLTGTTGADGTITVGLDSDGTLYIENRTGATRSIRLSVMV